MWRGDARTHGARQTAGDGRIMMTHTERLQSSAWAEPFEVGDESSPSTPPLVFLPFSAELLLAWQGADANLNFLTVRADAAHDAYTWANKGHKEILSESTWRAPALAATRSKMAMAWTGANEQMALNFAVFDGDRGLFYYADRAQDYLYRLYGPKGVVRELRLPKMKDVKEFWMPKFAETRIK